jgi:threonine/homoserine/homoserine lactone efflux protein
MRASVLALIPPGVTPACQTTRTAIIMLALMLVAVVLAVVVPAVWSRNRDRRHAARAVLRDILHAITGYHCKRLK